MSQSIKNLEKRRLLDVASEYERKCYSVLLEPREGDLPGFLSGFRPDMIASNPQENVVVEVRSRSSLAGANHLIELAYLLDAMPGWRLELVVTNPRVAPILDDKAEELDRAEIETLIARARELSSVTQEDAATLLAWSATEAALRLLAKQSGIQLESNQPLFIIKDLFSLGLLSREDYDLLQEGLRLRNLIAHGYRTPQRDASILGKLTSKAQELLEGGAKYPAA